MMKDLGKVDLVYSGTSDELPENIITGLAKLGGVSPSEIIEANEYAPVIVKSNIKRELAEDIASKFSKFNIVLEIEKTQIEASIIQKTLALADEHLDKNKLLNTANAIKEKTAKASENLAGEASDFKDKAASVGTKFSGQAKGLGVEGKRKAKHYFSKAIKTLGLTATFVVIIIAVAFTIPLLGALPFLDESSEIEFVKTGAVDSHPQNQIGLMFEQAFDSGNWGVINSSRGVRVVEFTGEISEDLHQEAILWLEQQGYGQLATGLTFNIHSFAQAVFENKNLHRIDPEMVELVNAAFDSLDDNAKKIGCEVIDITKIPTKSERYKCPKGAEIKSLEILKDYLFWPVGKVFRAEFSLNPKGDEFELTFIDGTWTFLKTLAAYNVVTLEGVSE
jgi:hypothetical protein